jgi:hypothetical protein
MDPNRFTATRQPQPSRKKKRIFIADKPGAPGRKKRTHKVHFFLFIRAIRGPRLSFLPSLTNREKNSKVTDS